MSNVLYTTSFVLEQLTGVHDFSTDTFKLALFGTAGALSQATTAYSATGEVANGNGYTTGGATMTLSATYPKTEDGRASARFETVSWTFTANTDVRYALMYNSSQSAKSVAVFDFGQQRTYKGSFQISFPLTQPALILATAPAA